MTIDATEHQEAIRLIKRAGRGDLEAQRGLVALSCRLAGEAKDAGDMDYAGSANQEAAIFARMAASHGNLADLSALISVLSVNAMHAAQCGDVETNDIFTGEAIALAEIISDKQEMRDDLPTSERVDNAFFAGTENASTRAVQWAKALYPAWKGEDVTRPALPDVYSKFRDGFKQALDPRKHTIEWIDEQVAAGVLKFVHTEKSAVLFSIVEYPTGMKELQGGIATGDPHEIANILIPQTENLARSVGCTTAQLKSREGCTPKCPDYGVYQIISEKVL